MFTRNIAHYSPFARGVEGTAAELLPRAQILDLCGNCCQGVGLPG